MSEYLRSERVSEQILREGREDRIMVTVDSAHAAMERARQEGDEDGYKRGLSDERSRIVALLHRHAMACRSSARSPAVDERKHISDVLLDEVDAIQRGDHWRTDGEI